MIIKNQPNIVSIPLRLPSGDFAIDPPVVAGDIQISLDGGGFANPETPPTVTAGSAIARVALSAAESNVDTVDIRCLDPDGAWVEDYVVQRTTLRFQPLELASLFSAQIANDWADDTNGWENSLPVFAELIVNLGGGGGGGGGSVDLDQVLTKLADIPTTDLSGALNGLVEDVAQIEKLGDTILHTRVASERGVSNTVVKTRV